MANIEKLKLKYQHLLGAYEECCKTLHEIGITCGSHNHAAELKNCKNVSCKMLKELPRQLDILYGE